MKTILPLFLAGLLSLFFVGCEDDEDSAIFAAQQCIDTATAATVDGCLTKIASMTSVEAFTLKCAADFIKANITETEIANALENIDNQGTDPTASIITNFKFADTTASNQAVSNCTATGSQTLITLVNTAHMATVLIDTTNGCIGGADPTTYINGYNDGDCTGQGAIDLGNVLINNQDTFCGDSGLYKDSDVCTNLNTAIADHSGDPAAIADQFLQGAD